MGTVVLLLLLGVIWGGVLPGLFGLALAVGILVPHSVLSSSFLILALLGSLLVVGRIVGVALEGSGEVPHTTVIGSALTLCCVGLLGGTSFGRDYITEALIIAANPVAVAQFSVYLTVIAGAAVTAGAIVGGGVLIVSTGCEFAVRAVLCPAVSVSIPWGAVRMLSWIAVIGFGCNTIGSAVVKECAPLSIVQKVAGL